jgi:hypothetical protein
MPGCLLLATALTVILTSRIALIKGIQVIRSCRTALAKKWSKNHMSNRINVVLEDDNATCLNLLRETNPKWSTETIVREALEMYWTLQNQFNQGFVTVKVHSPYTNQEHQMHIVNMQCGSPYHEPRSGCCEDLPTKAGE